MERSCRRLLILLTGWLVLGITLQVIVSLTLR
jgi:hypothetical protein